MNTSSVRNLRMALAVVAGASLLSVGYAQQADDTAKKSDDQAVKMEKFEVTGSYLPMAANSVAVPIISIDSKAIANSGNNTDLLEVLRKTTPQFSGNGNLGAGNANVGSGSTNGGSQLALRNTATLVLINGRRVAYSPVGASGGYQFVDVNMIPVAAVERIEVLADGASAIYGTDAVAGVVNVILKTDYQGFEVGGRYGFSTNTGHYAERSGYVVGGASDKNTSITLAAEWLRTDPIFAFERPYSAVTYGTPTFPGSVNIGSSYYYLSPSLNAPTVAAGGQSAAALVAAGVYSGPRTSGAQFQLFNLARYVTQKIGNERQSLTLAFEHQLTDDLKLFGDFLYANTQTYSQINGQPLNIGSLPAGQYGNPFNVAATGRNRLIDHPRQYLDDTTGIRGVVGMDGRLGNDWTWEVAANYNRITQDYSNPGVINNANLISAVEDGAFNMFARVNNPALYGPYNIVGTATGGFVSTLSNYDFKLRGKLFDVPAGSVDAAVGGEVRVETLTGIADPLSIPDADGNIGWNGATSLSPFTANRHVQSVFAEVRVPLLSDVPGAHLLEFSGAIRHENYDNTSDPTVPKLTLRYLPFDDQFALRSTFSKSFTAPTLYNLFGAAGIGYTSPFTLTPHDGSAPIDNVQTNYKSTSNPNLDPAKSTNYTFGVVYSPKAIKGLSLSVDYWHIKQTDLISSYGGSTILQSVEDLGAASPYASRVKVGGFNGAAITAPGQISTGVQDDIYVTDSLVNLSSVKLDGFDITAKYTTSFESIGRFDFGTNIGVYNHYQFVFLPGDAPFETVGFSTVTNGTIPRWSSYTTVDYSRGAWAGFIGWRFLPRVTDIYDNTNVSSFSTFDLSGSYTFGSKIKYLAGAKVTLGVNNVFNRFGPLDPTVNTDANVDISTYGSIGRFIYIDLKYKF